jgi:hypothetical protein
LRNLFSKNKEFLSGYPCDFLELLRQNEPNVKLSGDRAFKQPSIAAYQEIFICVGDSLQLRELPEDAATRSHT